MIPALAVGGLVVAAAVAAPLPVAFLVATTSPLLEQEGMSGWKPRAVSFSSGGAKVIGQMGTIARLMEAGVLDEVREWYGCSGGAVCALLGALGVTAAWIREAAEHFDVAAALQLTDDPIQSLTENWGLACAEHYRDFLGRFVDTWEPGASTWTFADFAVARPGICLRLIATNVTQGHQAIFGVHETPDMRILDAVMASCAVPLFFTPWRDVTGDIYTDGAVLEYYPWRCVDDKENTLVIVCEEHGIQGRRRGVANLGSASEFVERILQLARSSTHAHVTPPRNWIALNNHDVGILEFHMSRETRTALFRGGERAAAGWLAFRTLKKDSTTDSAGGTNGNHPQCADPNTSSSVPPSPDKTSDNPQSQNPQPPVVPFRDSHTGEPRISRRWSL